MAEPTLAIPLTKFQAHLGEFLGWGLGPAFGDPAFTAAQAFAIAGDIDSGQRRFYYPEPIPPSTVSYDWSFLHPTATLTLVSGQPFLVLPDDFGGLEGPVTILTANLSSQPWLVEWRNIGLIRQMFQTMPNMTGPPQYVSQDALKSLTALRGQRFQLEFFPTPDQNYIVQLTYYINPDALTAALPFPYGGAQHAETMLEACLAVAEERQDDQPRGTGPHALAFEKRLAASIAMDRKNKPQKLGANRDRSDDLNDRYNPHWLGIAGTYNGNSMG